MNKAIAILSFLLISCGNNRSEKKFEEKDKARGDSGQYQKDSLTSAAAHQKPGYKLEYKDDSLMQTMDISYITPHQLKFSLTTTNIAKGKKENLTGLATMNMHKGNSEYDQSEDGIAFLYDDWNYINGKCELDIRISDSTKFVRVFEHKCEKLRDPDCPFAIDKVLQRVDLK
jgi:hypothetical protein